MQPSDTVSALRELARAASRLAELLAPSAVVAVGEAPAWRSPTLELQAVIVLGEEDLPLAFGRGHRELIHDGDGGLPASVLSGAECVRHLAFALAGDVALEAAHAGLNTNGAAVDAMLARGLGVLSAAASAAGLSVPSEVFLEAALRFPELDARGSEWR